MRSCAASIAAWRGTDLTGYGAVRDDVRLAGEHVAHEVVNRVFGRGEDVVAGPGGRDHDLEILVAHHRLAELGGHAARLLSRCVVIIPLGKTTVTPMPSSASSWRSTSP